MDEGARFRQVIGRPFIFYVYILTSAFLPPLGNWGSFLLSSWSAPQAAPCSFLSFDHLEPGSLMTKKIDFESQTAEFTTQFCYLPCDFGQVF